MSKIPQIPTRITMNPTGGAMNKVSHASTSTKITNGGRIAIPAAYRHALGVKEGDEVIVKLIDGEILITTRLQELRRAQTIIAQHVPEDNSSWSDEIIAERHAEARDE